MPNQISRVRNQLEAQLLVRELVNPNRSAPICLLSTEFNSELTRFDTDRILRDLDGLAKIVIITTGEATLELAENLGPELQVFGGAARVYPKGFRPTTDEYIPLLYSSQGGTSKLINLALANSDLASLKSTQIKDSVSTKAIVSQIIQSETHSRALLKTSIGDVATIRQELSFPGIPFEWVFKIGDEVEGLLNGAMKTFVPELRFKRVSELLNSYKIGQVVPVFVADVTRKKANCVLYPGIEIEVTLPEISGNDLDKVTDFLTMGDVVGMRLYQRLDGSIGLRMNDIEDYEETSPAISIFANGEPWISEGNSYHYTQKIAGLQEISVSKTDVSHLIEIKKNQGALPGPGLIPGLLPNNPEQKLKGREKSAFEYEIKYLKENILALAAELDSVKTENSRLINNLASLESSLETSNKVAAALRRRGQKIHGSKSSPSSRKPRFLSDEEWFHEEIRRAWISNYSPNDRAKKYSLVPQKFVFGKEFFESFSESSCDESDLRKIIRCILDIATGREFTEPRRDVHPLRTGSSSSARDLIRADGAIALRAYIEEKSPAAKRLHYWALPNSNLEFMRVNNHNDFRI